MYRVKRFSKMTLDEFKRRRESISKNNENLWKDIETHRNEERKYLKELESKSLKIRGSKPKKELIGNLSKSSKLSKYGKAAMIAGGLGLTGIGAKMIYDNSKN